MKKKLLGLSLSFLGLIVLLNPCNANAEVVSVNFADTIKEEIEIFKEAEGAEEFIATLQNTDLSNYQESDEKVNVYIFRGSTCGYCLKAVAYFSSIVKDYGQYFNLKTYEVWNNQDNGTLLEQVADVFDETVSGVPYIVIGNKTFPGYASSMDESIKQQILDTYNSEEKYDVMNHLNDKKENIEDNKEQDNTKANYIGKNTNEFLILILIAIVIGFAVISVLIINFKNSIINLLDKKELLEQEKTIKQEETDIIKPAKKVKTKSNVTKKTENKKKK